MRFVDKHIHKEKRYTLGTDTKTGKAFLSIPVSNSRVDYEEYYEISNEDLENYPSNKEKIETFLEQCRKRMHDNKLLQQPGSDRGIPT